MDNTTTARPFDGTMGDRLEFHARTRPDALAVTTETGSISFAELAHNAECAAGALRAAGVGSGDRFAVLARNSSAYIELAYAASMSNSVMVGLNFRLSARETAEILDDCQATLLFVDDEWLHLLAEVVDPPAMVHLDRDYETWRATGEGLRSSLERNGSDAVVLQLYTGGTTGRAKGVMLTEGNIDANMNTLGPVWLMDDSMRALAVLPLFHVSGTGISFATLHAGGELILPREATPALILREIETRRTTHGALVPSMIAAVLAEPGCASTDLSSMRVMIYGAAPSAGTTIEEMMALMPKCGFFHGYGMTESCGGIAVSLPHYHGDSDDKHGTVGRPVSTYEFKIVDPNTLLELPADSDGEIWVRGPQNTVGYWNRPDDTARLFSPDGWLRTGDVGAIDADGFVYLRDRLKDMIISGGENVYSVEVENVIIGHPAVVEAAVFGVADERWGEAVHATVTIQTGATVTADVLMAFVRERLAHYKCPKMIEIVDQLPKSGSGKILKRELRAASLNRRSPSE